MRLACITVPNFRIALEQRRAPGLAGHPAAIGEPPPGTNEIIECSPEASVLGVRTGMPVRDARTLAPDLVVLSPDPVFYDRASEAMLAALEAATPLVEPAAPGTAYTELLVDPLLFGIFSRKQSNAVRAASSTAASEARSATSPEVMTDPLAAPPSSLLLPSSPAKGEALERQAAARLLDAITAATGVTACAGVAANKFVASIAATTGVHGAITIVPSGEEETFAASLSTAHLPVSYETQRKLVLYALHTIGDVARMPVGALQAQFGREGRRLYELSHGIDTAPFRPRTRTEPIAGTLQMPAPTVNTSALLIAARQLVGRLLQHRTVAGRQVRQLRLRMALLDGGSWERTLTFREPISDEEHIVYVLKKLIEPLQLAGPVDEMSVEFLGLTGEVGKQRSLLFAEQARRHVQLIAALRQLKTQFGGAAAVARVVEVEPWSRIPERRYALIDYDL